jgi:hypothetical protein
VAAPVGRSAVVVVPEQGSNGRVLLYEGAREVSPLPIGAEVLAWSSDAGKVYFYCGSTLEADAWNILGVLKLGSLAISKAKLPVPTEDINICSANGHVFAGIVSLDRNGHAEPYAAAELDSELRLNWTKERDTAGKFFGELPFGCKSWIVSSWPRTMDDS